MPTLVYLVHGMGCGTADGAERPAEKHWSAGAVDACRWICRTFALAEPTVVDPLGDTIPDDADADDAIWLVPVSYHRPFDVFRREAQNRQSAVAAIGLPNVSDGDLAALVSKPFLWANCLDVLLWWADRAEAQNHATTMILHAITHVDRLIAKQAPGATTRRLLVSHSLGTAAATVALADHLGREDAWLDRGAFEAWFTLANVAPFVVPPSRVYAPPLIPGRRRSLITGAMYNARHELDPIPRLLPWRMFGPDTSATFRDDWARSTARGAFSLLSTRGVMAVPNGRADIGDVHGFANYLMAPDVASRLAGHLRGEPFSDAELAGLDVDRSWRELPALRCTRQPGALGELADAVRDFVARAPAPEPGDAPPTRWVAQLLRGAELLAAAKERC